MPSPPSNSRLDSSLGHRWVPLDDLDEVVSESRPVAASELVSDTLQSKAPVPRTEVGADTDGDAVDVVNELVEMIGDARPGTIGLRFTMAYESGSDRMPVWSPRWLKRTILQASRSGSG